MRKMPTRLRLASLTLIAITALPLAAQEVRIFTRPDGQGRVVVFDDRPMIGVTTASASERADTLGLRITDITEDSPAAKAGLKVGDRLQSVNGVNLRADRADAGEEDYDGVLNRRLQREVQRTKEGESVELRVVSDGQARTVRVTPVPGRELARGGAGAMRGAMAGPDREVFRRLSDRAVLGFTVGSTGSIRDTAGVFVSAVTKDGPAEKAGIIEGDRIAAINGVSLKMSREDAEDGMVGASRVERLTRELAKLEAGAEAALTVVSAGRSRSVRVRTVRASELRPDEPMRFEFSAPRGTIRTPEGGVFEFRGRPEELPGIIERRFDDGELRRRLEEIAPRLRQLQSRRAITVSI
jgi:serine protease Do